MSKVWDVLGIGAVAVDDLIYLDRYPEPDTKLPIRERRREGGGLAGTALVAASRLGARAAYCGVLGEDELSRFTIEELEREGVDCGPVLRREEARPYHSLIIVDRTSGQRSILFSAAGVTQPPQEALPEDLIRQCRLLFVDHTVVESGIHAASLARAHGIPVLADIERHDNPLLPELLRLVDHLIVGVRLAGALSGESEPAAMVRALAGTERECCVVTAGERGCWYLRRGEEVRHFPAFAVRVVDTNGCGDVFHGAYAACVARWESIPTAVRVAAAAAGIKATCPGGRSGIPSRDAVDRFLREHSHG